MWEAGRRPRLGGDGTEDEVGGRYVICARHRRGRGIGDLSLHCHCFSCPYPTWDAYILPDGSSRCSQNTYKISYTRKTGAGRGRSRG